MARSFTLLAGARVAIAAAGLGAQLACGAGGLGAGAAHGERPESPFPSREELDRLADTLVPGWNDVPMAVVDTWRLTGPLPDTAGDVAITEPDGWEELLVEAARRKAGLVVASEAMRCAARELSRFYLEHQAYPAEDLRRFIFGRCGATSVSQRMAHVSGELPEGASDEEVRAAWQESARDLIGQILGAGPQAAGLAFARGGDTGVLLGVAGERRVHVDAFSTVPDAEGFVRIRGEVFQHEEELSALMNRGAFDVAGCEADPTWALPRFSLACAPAQSDRTSWLGLAARPSGRLLSQVVLDVLLRPSGDAADAFARSKRAREPRLTRSETFGEDLLATVNDLRQEARLRPLTLEPRETEVATRLSPIFFASHLGEYDAGVTDTVALGLMAGWDVDGVVREAHFGAALVLQTRDLTRWLEMALEQPLVRTALLGREVSRIALGPLAVPEEGEGYLGALLTTYGLFEKTSYDEERSALYRDVTRALAERGGRQPQVSREVEQFAADMAVLVRKGRVPPNEGLERILSYASTVLRAQVLGWYYELGSLGEIELPEEMYREPVQSLAIAVNHFRPPEGGWGRYVVFLIAARETPLRGADLQDPGMSRSAPPGRRDDPSSRRSPVS